MLKSIELFTGVGGLALGLMKAGYRHSALVEYNASACASLERNMRHLAHGDCKLFTGDIRDVDLTPFQGTIDLLAAGAPCQPFSIGGRHRAHRDERNLFPEVFRAVRQVRPKAILVENVKGLFRATFQDYVEYITLQLAFPLVKPAEELDPDAWRAHLAVLRKQASRGQDRKGMRPEDRYQVSKVLLNAANFGVPQRRERVFFVAIREDIGSAWNCPAPTHSELALRYAKLIDKTYWKAHGLRAPRITPGDRDEVLALSTEAPELLGARWQTVRDAIQGMPSPSTQGASGVLANHALQRGARTYPGHTGSPIDEPAKTLKAGVHGVPGGENMLRYPNGRVRYFTVREAARLQGIPDTYEVAGAWSEAMRQLGNAVPVDLAAAMGTSIAKALAPDAAHTADPLVAA